ncbi:MAG: Ig-like domain-containing protein [Anaerolineae bacterium]|nr:Ig-like domain-containing protein [Anaerolineae bacterium]
MNPEGKLLVRLTYVAGWALTALFVLAHLLLLAALVTFGLRAGGWALPPLAVAWYGLFALGSIPLLLRARRSENAPWLLLVPFALTLALVGAFGFSENIGRAVYGPYDPGDRYRIWALLQGGGALMVVSLAALYRWPLLLLAGLLTQAALILTNPEEWASLVFWGWPNLGTAALPLFVVPYALAFWVLNEEPSGRWRILLKSGIAGAVGSAGAVLGARYIALGQQGLMLPGLLPALFGAFVLGGLGVFALVLGAPSLKRAESRRRFPAEAAALFLGGASLLALPYGQLSPAGFLPRPGNLIPWVSPQTVVPNAWLPIVDWAGWLLKGLPWAAAPYALLGLGTALMGRRVRWALPEPPVLLMGIGIVEIGRSFLNLFLPTIRATYPPDFSLVYPDWMWSIPVGVSLILAGRAMTVHPATAWEERACPLGRAIVLGLLLIGLWYTATMGGLYLRAAVWSGLLAHLASFILFGLTVGRLMAAWWQIDLKSEGGFHTLRSRALWTLALLIVGIGVAVALTAPRVVRTVPANGATGVPLNTRVQIQMHPSFVEWMPGSPGVQFFAYYRDTGRYIPGTYGYWADGLFAFTPEESLRPGAPVEVVIRRVWERPYHLRFTTAGSDSPTAIPMPVPASPVGPAPTALPAKTP